MPKKGLVFIYDKLEENDFLPTPPTDSDSHQSTQSSPSKPETMWSSSSQCKRDLSEDSEKSEDSNSLPKKSQKSYQSQCERIQCKGCEEMVPYLRRHFSEMEKKGKNCKAKYTGEELKDFDAKSKRKQD